MVVETKELTSILNEVPPDWETALNSDEPVARTLLSLFNEWVDSDDPKALPLPWPSLSEKFGGLRPGELTIITGDTGHGKTTYALNWFYHLAVLDEPTMIFSLEMGPLPIVKKIFQMKTGAVQAKEKAIDLMTEFGQWATGVNLTVLDHYGYLPFERLKACIFWAAIKKNCHSILIDHFHCVTKPGMEASMIEFIAQELRSMAAKLKISLVVICHPAKKKGDAKEREIEMDELKGSSGLKQYADNVLSVFYDKQNNLTRLRLHKIRNDQYGGNMGIRITYSMSGDLKFQELDEGSRD